MSAVGSASAKLLLFGEHSAVYGFPALGIPLPWKTTVKLVRAENMQWKVAPRYLPRLNPLLSKLPEIFPELHSLSPLEIIVHSETPIGVGFGSSGALCVALTRAVFSQIGQHAQAKEIWSRAHALEAYFHTNPSGIDTGISTMEQGGYLQKKGSILPSFQPFKKKLPCLIVGAFPRSMNTSDLVSGLRQKMETAFEPMEHIEHLGEIAKLSLDQLDCPATFGELATLAHVHLKALGISIPELDSLLEKALTLGACGGKLSGSGGGGAFYIVCENRNSAEKIIRQLEFPNLYLLLDSSFEKIRQ
ncbi:putative mevalonate kinase [Waddlia chondrophila 2032/99]|uniref:Putative mevalonate kinase n=1 Tax=Waddlia chondrophila 2032/99 TaxID=765953 RepID=F8LCX3_9BACT|nr:putative mevalonate kinase [Waddlia chondrophila 2032/99]